MIGEAGIAGAFILGIFFGAMTISLARMSRRPPLSADFQPLPPPTRPAPPMPSVAHRPMPWAHPALVELHMDAARSALARPLHSRAAAIDALNSAHHFIEAAREELHYRPSTAESKA